MTMDILTRTYVQYVPRVARCRVGAFLAQVVVPGVAEHPALCVREEIANVGEVGGTPAGGGIGVEIHPTRWNKT